MSNRTLYARVRATLAAIEREDPVAVETLDAFFRDTLARVWET